MKPNQLLSILLAGVWVSISEFVRNEFLLKSYWSEHYDSLGLIFPSNPVNGIIWGFWSLLFATALFVLMQRFSLIQATLISWFMAFLLMWVALGNMLVLPYSILYMAVPLSIIECFVAALIIKRMAKPKVE